MVYISGMWWCLGPDDEASGMFWSGLAKSAVREAAWEDVGVRARFLVGRWERGSADVGIDSGPGADISMGGRWCVRFGRM